MTGNKNIGSGCSSTGARASLLSLVERLFALETKLSLAAFWPWKSPPGKIAPSSEILTATLLPFEETGLEELEDLVLELEALATKARETYEAARAEEARLITAALHQLTPTSPSSRHSGT